MTLQLLFLSIDVASIASVVLLGARVVASFPRQLNAQLVALILFNTVCHIIVSRYLYGPWIPGDLQFDVRNLAPVLGFLRNSTPGLLMILAHRLFVDGRVLPRWLIGLFAFQMLLEAHLGLLITFQPLQVWLDQTIPALLESLFVGFGLYWTIADWRSDLIDARRGARALVTVIIGSQVIASSLLLRVVIPGSTIANFYTHEAIVLAGFLTNAFVLMRIDKDSIRRNLDLAAEPITASRAQPESANRSTIGVEAPETVARLTALLEQDRIYREAGLTLAELALKVGLPEYRLRRLIHEALGHRNFNVFLHTYRIREACELLRDPKQRRTPILTIALSVGYQSVNTFNRGFREVMGVTPSEFRSGEPPQAAANPQLLTPKTE